MKDGGEGVWGRRGGVGVTEQLSAWISRKNAIWFQRCVDSEYVPTYIETSEDVPLVEYMYLVSACMPGESYRKRLKSLLLYLCDDFRV